MLRRRATTLANSSDPRTTSSKRQKKMSAAEAEDYKRIVNVLTNDAGIAPQVLEMNRDVIQLACRRVAPHASNHVIAKELWRAWTRALQEYHAIQETSLKSVQDVAKLLRLVGFTSARSASLAKTLHPVRTDYSKEHLVDLAFAIRLDGRFRPLRKPRDIFCFPSPAGPDEWFRPQQTTELRNASLYHMNVQATTDLASDHGQLLASLPSHHQQQRLVFHATSWRSALAICNLGPRHFEGRPCLDFGYSPSFYVTDEIAVAEEWADKHRLTWQGETAIVVFCLPVAEIDERLCAHLSSSKRSCRHLGNQANDTWRKFVKISRTCDKDNVENELDEYDVVIGPMVGNVRHVLDDKQPPKTHQAPRMQLASKSASADRFLKRCLCAVMWLEKE